MKTKMKIVCVATAFSFACWLFPSISAVQAAENACRNDSPCLETADGKSVPAKEAAVENAHSRGDSVCNEKEPAMRNHTESDDTETENEKDDTIREYMEEDGTERKNAEKDNAVRDNAIGSAEADDDIDSYASDNMGISDSWGNRG